MERYGRAKVAELRPHPKNIEIYGQDEDISDLIQKIKRSGQVHTVVITSANVIIAGHRRIRACKELGIKEVDVEIRDFDTPEQEIEYIIDNNATREKTNEQKAREAAVLKDTLSILAKRRKVSHLKQNRIPEVPKMAQREEASTEVPKMAQRGESKSGKTRDIIASKVGLKSGHEVDRAIKTVKRIDELKAEGKNEEAGLIRDVMNNRSVSAAESLAKNLDDIEIPEKDIGAIRAGIKSPNQYIKQVDKNATKSSMNPNIEEEKGGSEEKRDILVKVQERYQDYLLGFQKDIEWMLGLNFYQDDEDITEKIHSDLRNSLEKFRGISGLLKKMYVDDLGDISMGA